MGQFKRGDTVVLRGHKRRIGKVGRKYVYLEGDSRNAPYDIETGRLSDSYALKMGTGVRIVPLAEWEEMQRRDLAVKELMMFGMMPVTPGNSRFGRVPTEKLETILAVLQECD